MKSPPREKPETKNSSKSTIHIRQSISSVMLLPPTTDDECLFAHPSRNQGTLSYIFYLSPTTPPSPPQPADTAALSTFHKLFSICHKFRIIISLGNTGSTYYSRTRMIWCLFWKTSLRCTILFDSLQTDSMAISWRTSIEQSTPSRHLLANLAA